MNYTKEQVDIMIKSACDTQKEIDYNTFKNIVNGMSVQNLINHDYCYTKENLDKDLDESDLSNIRDCWTDIDDQLDIIKNYIIKTMNL